MIIKRLWSIIFVIFFISCSHNSKNFDTLKKESSFYEIYLDRIVSDHCDGSYLNVELKNGSGMFEGMIIVSKGSCIKVAKVLETDEWIPVETTGTFVVNKKLDMYVEGDWDGKCMGAKHTINGTLTFYDYEFSSDPENPLIFMMTDKGYQYLQGKGEVKDLISGKEFTFS